MNSLAVFVCVIPVIAQFLRLRGLCLGYLPLGRIVEVGSWPAAVLDPKANGAKLLTALQGAHRSLVRLPNQHRQ